MLNINVINNCWTLSQLLGWTCVVTRMMLTLTTNSYLAYIHCWYKWASSSKHKQCIQVALVVIIHKTNQFIGYCCQMGAVWVQWVRCSGTWLTWLTGTLTVMPDSWKKARHSHKNACVLFYTLKQYKTHELSRECGVIFQDSRPKSIQIQITHDTPCSWRTDANTEFSSARNTCT